MVADAKSKNKSSCQVFWKLHKYTHTDAICYCHIIRASNTKIHYYTLKKRTNFKTVQLEITRIDFDDILQKYSKDSRTEFACFSFHVGLLVITLSSLKVHTENVCMFLLEIVGGSEKSWSMVVHFVRHSIFTLLILLLLLSEFV